MWPIVVKRKPSYVEFVTSTLRLRHTTSDISGTTMVHLKSQHVKDVVLHLHIRMHSSNILLCMIEM